MWAYGRLGLAVCFVQWDDGWRIFVGAVDESTLGQFGSEFGVAIEAA
jgi:hypothetical protein